MWFVNLRGVALCRSANDQAGELVAGQETGFETVISNLSLGIVVLLRCNNVTLALNVDTVPIRQGQATESKIREFVTRRSSREERAPQRVGSVSAYLGDRWISTLRGGDTGFH